jgi:predicted nucleotidyltransferase
MSVNDAIRHALTEIEATRDVRVLYAAESGSRAWGFASPDSDYDVRFIYVHRLEWYLRVGEARDVIEAMLPGDLDLSGWEVRKALGLFKRTNLALNEWLDSPIVYVERGDFAQRMRALIAPGFRTPAGHNHYLSLAKRKFDETLASDPVRLKDVFYALRALLACRWIRQTASQPPTEFRKLVDADGVAETERRMIAELMAAKVRANEGERSALAPAVRAWLERELDLAKTATDGLRSSDTLQTSALDELLRATVLGQ